MREVFAAILDNAMVAGIMILVIVLMRVFMRKSQSSYVRYYGDWLG